MQQRISRKQILEWTENPVTILFREETEKERDEIFEVKGLGAFHPFDAHKTQELLAGLNGYVDALDRQIAATEGEGFFQDDDTSDQDESV